MEILSGFVVFKEIILNFCTLSFNWLPGIFRMMSKLFGPDSSIWTHLLFLRFAYHCCHKPYPIAKDCYFSLLYSELSSPCTPIAHLGFIIPAYIVILNIFQGSSHLSFLVEACRYILSSPNLKVKLSTTGASDTFNTTYLNFIIFITVI